MPPKQKPLFLWLLFPAVTMSLGWGLRGFIGGGPLGAMIPGAMVALALLLLLERNRGAALVAAFGAVGVGFGGQETYGQTVGLSLHPETFAWAITGFFLKGAAWGLLGGVALALAFTLRARSWRQSAGFAILVAALAAAWRLINQPKLIYFSNRIDKPREEIWAGLLCAGLAWLLWSLRDHPRLVMLCFAALGTLGGGAGFALGAAIQAWGRPSGATPLIDWWKIMEFTFGALLGAAYGLAAYLSRDELTAERDLPAPASPLPSALLAAAALSLAAIGWEYKVEIPFAYTFAGILLMLAALRSNVLAWHAAISVTCCAFFLDLMENKAMLAGAPGWAMVVVLTAAVALAVARAPRPYAMFLLMTWASTGIAVLKLALPPAAEGSAIAVGAVFVAMAVASTIWARRFKSA